MFGVTKTVKRKVFILEIKENGERGLLMKYYSILIVCLLFFIASCTATLEQGEIVLNFCDADTTDYIDCTAISLTTDTVVMQFETTSSDVVSLDSIILELPDEEVYCSSEADDITSDDDGVYDVLIACDALGDYEDQNTQLAFTVTLTLSDDSTVTETGSAEDWV